MPIMALAAASSAAGAVGYNRSNFLFDKELSQKREFQAQKMRIKQYGMYREDIRDLVQLTVRKMDNYLIVNTIQLGFCLTLLIEGRPRPNPQGAFCTPGWLITLYALCTCGAFVYYLLSIFLAMHASIAAHSVGVRMLTQHVRLPIPTSQELDAVTAAAADFEAASWSDILRIPMLRRQMRALQEALSSADGTSTAGDETVAPAGSDGGQAAGTALEHFALFKKVQKNWQAFDAYARVCMAMGTNQIIHAMIYEILILLEAENNLIIPALFCIICLSTSSWILAKLDLYHFRLPVFAAMLLLLPPTLASVTMFLYHVPHAEREAHQFGKLAVPVVFVLHLIWTVFSTRLTLPGESMEIRLPHSFRGVLYLDPFFYTGGGPPENSESLSLERLLRLRKDLERWESRPAQERIADDLHASEAVSAARKLFDELCGEMRARGVEVPPAGDADGDEREPLDDEVWLVLLSEEHGLQCKYYYCCETEATQELAPRGSRISDIHELRASVEELATDVRCGSGPGGDRVADHFSSDAPAAGATDDRRESTGRLPWEMVKLGRRMLIVNWLLSSIWAVSSVSLGIRIRWRSEHGPPKVYVASELPPEPARPAWITGLGAVYLGPDRPSDGVARPWPAPLLRPVGLACHARLGRLALLAGRYSVAVAPLPGADANSTAEAQAALDACLAASPTLQRRGLAGISLSCPGVRGSACAALLLGAGGREALRCPLIVGRGAAVAAEEARARREPVSLLGGPWRSLVADDAGGVWAAAVDHVAWLTPRGDASAPELEPQMDVDLGDEEGMEASVHVDSSRGALLVLSRAGGAPADGASSAMVRAWPLAGGPVRQWRLPSDGDKWRWTSMCTMPGDIYLVGEAVHDSAAGSSVGLFRVDRPY